MYKTKYKHNEVVIGARGTFYSNTKFVVIGVTQGLKGLEYTVTRGFTSDTYMFEEKELRKLPKKDRHL